MASESVEASTHVPEHPEAPIERLVGIPDSAEQTGEANQHQSQPGEREDAQEGQQDERQGSGRQISRRRRIIKVTCAIIKAILVLEGAAWALGVLKGSRRGRSSSEYDSDLDPVEQLMDYLGGKADVDSLAQLGSSDLLDAAEQLETEDLQEMGYEATNTQDLQGLMQEVVQDIREARKTKEAAAKSQQSNAAAAASGRAEEMKGSSGSGKDSSGQQQEQQQEPELQEKLPLSAGPRPKGFYPWRKRGLNQSPEQSAPEAAEGGQDS